MAFSYGRCTHVFESSHSDLLIRGACPKFSFRAFEFINIPPTPPGPQRSPQVVRLERGDTRTAWSLVQRFLMSEVPLYSARLIAVASSAQRSDMSKKIGPRFKICQTFIYPAFNIYQNFVCPAFNIFQNFVCSAFDVVQNFVCLAFKCFKPLSVQHSINLLKMSAQRSKQGQPCTASARLIAVASFAQHSIYFKTLSAKHSKQGQRCRASAHLICIFAVRVPHRYRATSAHIRQSRPDSSLSF